MIGRRFAPGKREPVAEGVTELVQMGVDALVATDLQETQAARQATRTIPIAVVVERGRPGTMPG